MNVAKVLYTTMAMRHLANPTSNINIPLHGRQKMNNKIRAVTQSDTSSLKKVVDSCELFPFEYLDEMISDYFNNPDTQDIWFTHLDNNKQVAIRYCVPEKLTYRTYNLLAIGVSQ